MKNLISLISLLLLTSVASAQHMAVTVNTNGVLSVNANGRSTNFFKTNMAAMREALRNELMRDVTHSNATVMASTITGSVLTNVTAYDRIDIGPVATSSALVVFNSTYEFGMDNVTQDVYLQNTDSGVMLQRWEYGGNTVITSPTVISNNLSVRTNFTANGLATFQAGVTETNVATYGTNKIAARVDFTSRANTALVNGANAGIILGSNVYVRLSGATTVAGISGFAAEQDGSFHIVQITGAITNVIVNEANSTDIATDPTPANRIVIGTGTNWYSTNSPLSFPIIYDGTASRWRVIVFR